MVLNKYLTSSQNTGSGKNPCTQLFKKAWYFWKATHQTGSETVKSVHYKSQYILNNKIHIIISPLKENEFLEAKFLEIEIAA